MHYHGYKMLFPFIFKSNTKGFHSSNPPVGEI